MIFIGTEFRRAGSQTLSQILESGITDRSVTSDDARNQLRERLRAVYRPNIRSIMVVSRTLYKNK